MSRYDQDEARTVRRRVEYTECPTCEGAGELGSVDENKHSVGRLKFGKCPTCKGRGEVPVDQVGR